DRAHTDIVGLARRVAEMHQRASRLHRVVVEASPDALWGTWDAARLERSIDNLVGNAIKYSPEGGEVTLRLWEEDGDAVVRVADQGLGIPEKDLGRVFERFHRGANVAGRISGTGIGLASVQQ